MTKKETMGSSTNLTSALSEAQSIIAAAESRAKELLAEAKKVFDAARADGYQEGLTVGREDAVEEAVRLLSDTSAVSERLAAEAAKLAIAISETVIGEHVKVEPETAKKIAQSAIREAVTGDSITLIAHKDDIALLEEGADDLRRIAGGASIAFEASSEITRGGCLVRTEFGEVDATIDTLLSSVRERLGLAK